MVGYYIYYLLRINMKRYLIKLEFVRVILTNVYFKEVQLPEKINTEDYLASASKQPIENIQNQLPFKKPFKKNKLVTANSVQKIKLGSGKIITFTNQQKNSNFLNQDELNALIGAFRRPQIEEIIEVSEKSSFNNNQETEISQKDEERLERKLSLQKRAKQDRIKRQKKREGQIGTLQK